jgi:phenylalanyl-tRNA synthetase alpha chain
MTNLKQIITEAESKISSVSELKEIEDLKVHYLGKSGEITSLMKNIATLPPEEKKSFGAEVNNAKNIVTDLIERKKSILETAELNKKLENERIDVTLPIRPEQKGSIHPISAVVDELIAIMGNMGFELAEGPEIEDDFHNFTALNIPESHPARQMHDTFYIKNDDGKQNTVLRTHTSPVQIRAMKAGKPPFKIFATGRTFRCDSDQTHSPMFNQIEGFYVDKNINMGHLKGCLQEFLDKFFGMDKLEMRFRPSFFPFTEPSAEVDIRCDRGKGELKIGEGTDWLEILGCGMIHPNVLRSAGIDPEEYQGFAFGAGIERLAMLKYGISDLRNFYNSDIRFLEHYKF